MARLFEPLAHALTILCPGRLSRSHWMALLGRAGRPSWDALRWCGYGGVRSPSRSQPETMAYYSLCAPWRAARAWVRDLRWRWVRGLAVGWIVFRRLASVNRADRAPESGDRLAAMPRNRKDLRALSRSIPELPPPSSSIWGFRSGGTRLQNVRQPGPYLLGPIGASRVSGVGRMRACRRAHSWSPLRLLIRE